VVRCSWQRKCRVSGFSFLVSSSPHLFRNKLSYFIITDMNDMAPNLPNASARLAAIVESSGDAIISKDLNGVITSWNRAAERMFGYTAEEAIGQPVTMLMPEDRINEEPSILERIRSGETVDHYETIRRHKDGTLLDISLNVSPIHDDRGVVVGASKIGRDITDLKNAGAELAKLASIVESSGDAIISKDLNGIITSWNRGAEEVFGYTAEEAIGRPVTMLMPPDRVNEEPGILARIRRGEKVDHYETIRRHKSGRLLDISLNVSPIFDAHGVIVGASKIARNITDRKRNEEARREAELLRRLMDAQEAERQRIARDLHDHLGQQMTALRFKIQSLKRSVDDPELIEKIDTVDETANKMDRDIGLLSWALRPTELEELGLEGALSSFVQEWAGQFGIDAEFRAQFPVTKNRPKRLSKAIETNLYRIAQEALNNISKHAGAGNVSVLLHYQEGHIALVIEDDGKGFEKDHAANSKTSGYGLVGMQERADLLHGTLEVESEPGNGATILVRVPVTYDDPAD